MSAAASPLNSISSAVRPLGVAGGAAVGVGLLAAAALGWSTVLLAQAAFTPSKVAEPPAAQQQERLAKYEAGLDKRAAQSEGRSMFFAPVAPNKPVEEEKKEDDKPPPPPVTYEGPGLVAIVYDRVWFDDGRSMSPADAEDSGLAVVDVSPPWAARLRWRGVEFDVTLFSRTTDEFLDSPKTEEAEPQQ
ncbi:MAG: hypothetical protein ACKVZJ_15535 [Phycisphaerales bacterium]